MINSSCTVAMIRVQTPAASKEDGHAMEQALQQRFVEKYGNSIGMKGTRFQGTADAARWIAGSLDVVSVYDPTHAADARDDVSADSVFAGARLSVVYETEQNACCRLKAYRHRSIENAQFHRAIALTGVDANLSERMGKLFDDVFRDGRSGTPSEREQQSEGMKWQQSLVTILQDGLNGFA